MSTQPTPPRPAGSPKAILTALAEVNGYVALALQIGNEIVPLAKGAIQVIHSIATGSETLDYEVVIRIDGAELDAVDKLASDDIDAINAELARLGQQQINEILPKP